MVKINHNNQLLHQQLQHRFFVSSPLSALEIPNWYSSPVHNSLKWCPNWLWFFIIFQLWTMFYAYRHKNLCVISIRAVSWGSSMPILLAIVFIENVVVFKCVHIYWHFCDFASKLGELIFRIDENVRKNCLNRTINTFCHDWLLATVYNFLLYSNVWLHLMLGNGMDFNE